MFNFENGNTATICGVIMLVCVIICCIIMPRLLKFFMGVLTAGMGVGVWTSGLSLCGVFNSVLFSVTGIILFAGGVACQTLGYDIKVFSYIGLGSFVERYEIKYVTVPAEQNIVVVQ